MPEGMSAAAQSYIKDGQVNKIPTPESYLSSNIAGSQLNTNSNVFIPPGKKNNATPEAALIPFVFREGEIVPKILTKPGSKDLQRQIDKATPQMIEFIVREIEPKFAEVLID